MKYWSHTITYFNYIHLDTSVFCIVVDFNVTACVSVCDIAALVCREYCVD